ncbi:MAG: hypothetical protein HZA53_00300 [Planctomycetes bacterium]|nr:hypothetical protein [Planctomycetota bacterium]
MSIRSRSQSLFAKLAPLALVTAPAVASGPVDHHVGVAPKADPSYATLPGGRAFVLPGLGDDFVFLTGGQFVELPTGQGRLVGVLGRIADPNKRFLADLTLTNRVNPGDPVYPPPACPTLELAPAAYSGNGGVIDPNGWHYWTSLTGTLTGLRDYRGAKLNVNERGPAFQCGTGANGRSLLTGASGQLRTTVLSQPIAGPAIAANIDGESHLDLAAKFVLKAEEAVSDPAVAQYFSSHAFYLSQLGDDWVFQAGGELEETADGTGRMTGVIQRVTQPNQKFFVDIAFSSRTNPGEVGYAPPGSPKLELLPSAMAANGGPVDPNHWYYYEVFSGKLTGLSDLAGVDYALTRRGPAFQVGVGANGKNLAWGGSGWLDLVLLAAPANSNYPQSLVGDVNTDFTNEENECTTKADALAGVGQLGGHAMYVLGLGDDFVFQPGGQFNEFADGTATLQGVLARSSDPSQRFLVSATFTGRLDPADAGYPPPMSPKMELVPSAYVSNGGGPVDADTWHYYQTTNGTLLGQAAFLGALVTFDRMGPAFQVGLGANGKNLNYGGSGWLNLYTQAQPSNAPQFPNGSIGDFNFDYGDDCPNCATRARNDPNATYTGGSHAFYLPGIGTNMVLVPGSKFEEFDDGTAHLTGAIYKERVPAKRFLVDVWFTNRVSPGELGYAPSGSPKKELWDWMYAENGGPVDANSWHYYLNTDGLLTGQMNMAGAQVRLTRMGPAFQVGLGANGKNIGFGASGWLNVQTLSQPTKGPGLPSSLVGDVNVNLTDGCP